MNGRRRHLRTVSIVALVVPATVALFGSAPIAAAKPASAPGWHLIKVIKANGLSLLDVTALPAGKAWVSAGTGTTTTTPLFYHRTGGKWVKIPRPGIASDNVFATDVSASTDTNVWGGLANASAVDHWNGHAWNRVSFSSTLDTAVDGVLAFSTNKARVFTFDFTTQQPAVNYVNGTTWTSKVLPIEVDADGFVNAVSESSGSNIWTLAFDPGLHRWETMHFDGTMWSVVTVPKALIPSPAGLAQIVALSPSNVWGTVTNNTSGPLILLHWNGTVWRKAAGSPPTGELLGAIASDGQGGVWLYATKPISKPPFVKPFFVHYAHGKWTIVAAPTSPLGVVFISALALIPGTRSLWAVGSIRTAESTVAGAIEQFTP
jgi:hypothetical protein